MVGAAVVEAEVVSGGVVAMVVVNGAGNGSVYI